MAGRTAYYGGIVLDGLVFHIDSAKQESYAKRGLRYTQNGDSSMFVDFADTSKSPSTQNAKGTIINGATFSNFAPYHLTPYYSTYWYNPAGSLQNTGIGTFYGNIEFDGVDDYISFSETPDINTTDLTVSAWFYVNKFKPSISPSGGTISMIASRYSNTTTTNGWEIGYNNNGVVWFGGRENSGLYISVTASLLVKQTNNITGTANGGWYNAVGIKSGNQWSISVAETNSYKHVDNIAKTYKGLIKHLPELRTIQAGTGTIPFGTNTLTVGKASNSNDYYMNGRLMNLSIYNRALSLAEINQNYDSFNKRIIEIVLTNLDPETCLDVTIGSQIWTSCNLNVSTYRNGDIIPQVTDPTAWASLTTGAWCYYNNDPANNTKYGKLYNWYAVTDPRVLAPIGYHVPTDAEWTVLKNHLGGASVAGGKLKEAGLVNWTSPNTDATNTSLFTGLGAGYRRGDGGSFQVGYGGWWWSSTVRTTDTAWYLVLSYNTGSAIRDWDFKLAGLSVRLIKD